MTQAPAPPAKAAKARPAATPASTGPGVAPRLWTADQYMHLAESGEFVDQRVELIDGIIYDMAAQGVRHSIVITIRSSASQ